YLDDARPVLAAADVVAIPSLTEGLPLVALEALALGRCVVASSVGELPELLAGGAGILVPAGDAPALSEALGRLQNGEVRERGERPRDHARFFRDGQIAAVAVRQPFRREAAGDDRHARRPRLEDLDARARSGPQGNGGGEGAVEPGLDRRHAARDDDVARRQ